MRAYARAALEYRKGAPLEALADAIAQEGGYRSTAAFLCELVSPLLTFTRREKHEAFIPLNGAMPPLAATRLQQILDGERLAPLCVQPVIKIVHAIVKGLEVDSHLVLNILDVFDWKLVNQRPAGEQDAFAVRLARGYLK